MIFPQFSSKFIPILMIFLRISPNIKLQKRGPRGILSKLTLLGWRYGEARGRNTVWNVVYCLLCSEELWQFLPNSVRIWSDFWCAKIRMIRPLGNRIFQPWGDQPRGAPAPSPRGAQPRGAPRWATKPSLFTRLVLGWINADFRVQIRLFQHFSRS